MDTLIDIQRHLRPPRAGSADADRRVLRTALAGLLDEHRHDAPRLRAAGYSSSEEFANEVGGLLQTSNKALSGRLFHALFGSSRDGGRLGRLLGVN
jgi:hypothetical protein